MLGLLLAAASLPQIPQVGDTFQSVLHNEDPVAVIDDNYRIQLTPTAVSVIAMIVYAVPKDGAAAAAGRIDMDCALERWKFESDYMLDGQAHIIASKLQPSDTEWQGIPPESLIYAAYPIICQMPYRPETTVSL